MVKLVSTLVWVALVAFLCFSETQAQRTSKRKYVRPQATTPEPIKQARRRDIPEEGYTGIIFEDDVTTAGNPTPNLPIRNQIPLSFLSQLSNYSNVNDILTRFGREDPVALHIRQGGVPFTATTSRGRNPGAKSAEIAGCEPQKMAVAFEKPSEPSVIYFPFCTRIERCGGCCPHDLFECSPTSSEKVAFQVTKLRYMGPGDGSLQYEGEITMDIDKHLSCDCQCRVKESDCRSNQIYLPNECRCECKNHEEAAKCVGMNKYWSPELCRCMCVQIPLCSSGSKINPETCLCESEHIRELRTYDNLDSTEVTSTQWFNRPGSRKRGNSRSRLAVFD